MTYPEASSRAAAPDRHPRLKEASDLTGPTDPAGPRTQPHPAVTEHPRPARPARESDHGQAPAGPAAAHPTVGLPPGVATGRRRQRPVDTALRCQHADDPARRPRCTLTATVRFGIVALCASCQNLRSTVGKGQLPVALPEGPAFDVLGWIAAAHEQADAAERTLTAAVIRARQAGHPWSVIGTHLSVSRQAAQQRFSRASVRESTKRATRAS